MLSGFGKGWLEAAPPDGLGSYSFVEDIELAVFFEVFISEFCLFVGEVDLASVDEGLGCVGGDFEEWSIGDNECRFFLWFDGAETVGEAEDLGGGEGDGSDGGFLVEAIGDGGCGFVGEVSDIGVDVGGGEAPGDAGGLKARWFGEGVVEGCVGSVGEGVGGLEDDGDFVFLEQLCAQEGVSGTHDDQAEIVFVGEVDGGGDLIDGVGIGDDGLLG